MGGADQRHDVLGAPYVYDIRLIEVGGFLPVAGEQGAVIVALDPHFEFE